MSPSVTVNVVRYSALTFGILYGIVHRRSLQTLKNNHQFSEEVHKREAWVDQAKQAWQRRQLQTSNQSNALTDPDSPLFDLEAFLTQLSTTSP
ncbi:hypothetical protein CROQUDRAFT_656699 [Cronartium quercuum f. sp. fusiforme G11]|uniref:ATP synthase F(0) complex subunit e, mitochondrial n=1 Tax=Cronartium quercuum f. sp. fusiforme G11 TaxID=708437 RepID=A0A9P6TC29_9BASI|nr:hypothetical protein CROQUDRAFT_656699 [Cronartium quercuum f. sp. fusiforme G11]